MYATTRNVTAFVTRNIKSFSTVLLTLFVGITLTFGCAGTSKSVELGNELFQGLNAELSQPFSDGIPGDAKNHTPFHVAFGIFKPTKMPSEPVFIEVLEPHETVYFSLLPGRYIMAGQVIRDGQVVKEFTVPFEIVEDGGDFGFDFRWIADQIA